jgi:hypothetical protein
MDTLEPLIRACGMEVEIVERAGVGIDRSMIQQFLRATPPERARLAEHAANELARIKARARFVE